jgi:hypothetical protein
MSEAEGEALPPVWRRRYAAMCFIWDISGVQEGVCRRGHESSSSVVEYFPPFLSETGSPFRSTCSFSATMTPLLTVAALCLCCMTYFCGELKENVNQFKL